MIPDEGCLLCGAAGHARPQLSTAISHMRHLSGFGTPVIAISSKETKSHQAGGRGRAGGGVLEQGGECERRGLSSAPGAL